MRQLPPPVQEPLSPPAAHVLPDRLRPGLRAVFCGTAAGAASARLGAYYAGPGNRFWPVLARVGLTPRRFLPHDFPLLWEHGIGLTDVAKTASGPDSALPPDAFDPAGLRERLAACRPRCLAFNGKKAAAAALGQPTASLPYGPVPAPGWPPAWVLPSTSGAASRFWSEAPWHALAAHLGAA